MTIKEMTLETIKKLPDSCSLDDIMEILWVQKKILLGQQQLKSGQGITHKEAKKQLEKWLK
jgi:hypothetical protein